MENKAHALAAGIFVTLLTVLVLGLAAWLTRDTGVRDTYEITTRETVTGLQEQAPVRYRGVDVGKVSSVGFDPKVPGNVLLRLQIDREAPLTRDTFAVLSFQGVTGLAFVQLSDEGKPAPRLVPNDEVPPRIPLRPGLLAKLEERGEVIMARIEEVATRVNQVLGDANQKRLSAALDNIGQAAGTTSALAQRLDQTVAKRVDPLLDEAAVTLRGARTTVEEVGRTATEFRTTAAEFGQTARRFNAPDGPMQRLGEGADSLSHAADLFGRSTLPRVNRIADEATRTVKSLNRAVNELTENPQALLYGEGAPRPGPGEPGFRTPEVRRLNRRLASLAALLALGACSHLPDKPMREALYDLGPGPVLEVTTAPAEAPLTLPDFEVNASLEGTGLMYRLGYSDPYQLRPYAYARWSAPPAQLLRQRLRDQLGQTRPVLDAAAGAALARRSGTVPPVLRVELEEFSQMFDSPESSRGVLRVRCTVLENTVAGDRVVAQRIFAVQQPAPSADAAGGVRALAAAADSAATQIADWLRQVK